MSAPIDVTDANGLPLVLFDDDLVRLLETSARTLKRWRRLKQFPIPELLPQLDRRHRYARADVLAFITRASAPISARRRA